MPEQYRIFCDYVDHRGTNIVLDGLSQMSEDDKAKMNEFLRQLERVKHFDSKDVKPLRNVNGEKGKGLYELRYKLNKVQQRPLGLIGPGGHELERRFQKPIFTILVMAEERNGRFVPPGAVKMCWTRLETIRNGHGKIILHDFS